VVSYQTALTSELKLCPIPSEKPLPVKAMVRFGSDPLLGHGDPLQGKAALEALDFYVHVDIVANPSAAFADLLLPASTCWEGEALESPVSRPEGTQEYPLVLTFFRLGQFCDEQHRHIPRLRRQVPEPLLEIHSHTATAAGIADGDWVVLETAIGRVRLKAKCNDALHPRVVATQYGWWQGCRELGLRGYDPFGPDGANVNLLIPNAAIDPISASVQHRSQMCRVRKED
jgi:anaerobic selenocysteine-containing dehydrogenase